MPFLKVIHLKNRSQPNFIYGLEFEICLRIFNIDFYK
jgi:hypothetical protein